MDHDTTNDDLTRADLEASLARLLEQLECADPAEAPELAASVADELQRRLRG